MWAFGNEKDGRLGRSGGRRVSSPAERRAENMNRQKHRLRGLRGLAPDPQVTSGWAETQGQACLAPKLP